MATASPDNPDVFDQTLVLLDVEEAARRLQLGRTTTYALIASGDLPSITVGRLRRVPVEALAIYTRRRMQESGINLNAA